MKTVRILVLAILFLGLAAVVSVVAGDKITKTTRLRLEISGCNYRLSGETKIKKNQNISLTVVSDRAGEFHIHGYELKKELGENNPETFNFRAVQSGIFDLEHHGCPAENHVWLTILSDDGSEPSAEEHKEEDKAEEAESSPDAHSESETQPHQE